MSLEAIEFRVQQAQTDAKEALTIAHGNEVNVGELKVLQKQNQNFIEGLYHQQKNIKTEIMLNKSLADERVTNIKEKYDKEFQDVKDILLKSSIKEETKKGIIKYWHMWLALGIGIFGAIMSIVDWFTEHFVKAAA